MSCRLLSMQKASINEQPSPTWDVLIYAPGRITEYCPTAELRRIRRLPGSSMNRQSGEVGAEKDFRAGLDQRAGVHFPK